MRRTESSISVRFSGLVFRFLFPEPIPVPHAFAALRCSGSEPPDEEIEIRLLHQPLMPDQAPVRVPGYEIYDLSEGRLCIYPALTAEDGCQVAFLCCPDGKNILYYPASCWSYYAHPLNCRHLIRGESLLFRHRAFLLHSSVVLYHDRAVLFSGPSGIGKSTQAGLWAKHLGAELINGDRCLIREEKGTFYGGGSLWCGTSEIYRPEYAPIAGIFLLSQSPDNRIMPAGRSAFPALYSQCTLNTWDPAFMEQLTDLLIAMIGNVPVFRLDCRPDRDAVLLARDAIF